MTPEGLGAGERAWLSEKAARAGGVTDVFHRLVRQAILFEALSADLDEHERLAARLVRRGVPVAEARRRLRAWTRSRASWRQRNRLANLITWDQPGGEHFYGRAPQDDPVRPLSRAEVRRLIAAGRCVFADWP